MVAPFSTELVNEYISRERAFKIALLRIVQGDVRTGKQYSDDMGFTFADDLSEIARGVLLEFGENPTQRIPAE